MVPRESDSSRLEIGHVLFIDIVGYSKLLNEEQKERLNQLIEIVLATAPVREATDEQLVRLPTGDGMALVFRRSAEEPARCALEIAEALQKHPELPVRMGIHSGPVSEVTDVSGRTNIAGAGINMAQRVMDCGDAGHILLSQHVADDLVHSRQWASRLRDLGECEVKHGVRLHLVNLYAEPLGNAALPQKLQQAKPTPVVEKPARRSNVGWIAALAVLVLLGAVFFLFMRKPTQRVVAAIADKSVAVLPFENLSSDKENAYFTDGVQDEILTNLAKIADLKVISRTSVMQYKSGAPRNLREIGQQLGVAHVVEGSVQRAANKVRMIAQLIDARIDAHLWAQTYDRDLADVFAIQSEIAKAIADQLEAKILPGEKAAIALAPTTDLTANDLYAQAKKLEFEAPEHQSVLQAIQLLEQAVARDPNFVLAYCALARMHLILFWGGYDHTPARRELANAAIQKAVHLQPDAGEVHLALARYAYHGFRDYDRARAELDLARRTLPNDAETYFLSAVIDRRQGRWTEATRNFERLVELDPRNVESLLDAADTYQKLRQYAESRRLFERAVAISPHHYFARTLRALQPLVERADARPLRAELSAILTEEPGAAEKIADVLFYCAMAERDSAAVNRAVVSIPAEGISPGGNFIYPREWFVAVAARAFNDTAAAKVSFTAARAMVEKIAHDQPDYASAWSLLGRIDAALGHKKDAVQEGRRACELMPLSKDASAGAEFITNLALIYAWLGEKDLALEQLATSSKIPAGVSYGELKLSPIWDALRGDSRFEKIVQSLALK
jgi:TolB-like protein/Tfp pilus assembly protein PilF